MVKTLYRGVFNYARSLEPIMYRYAYSKKQAWSLMCQEISRRNNVHVSHVYSLFDGSRNNFEITVELEVRENDAHN